MSDASDKPKATYAPVHTRRAFEEVTDQIRGQIARGALGPGDRLPSERDLAEQFSLSRNTVREALRALEIAGILELKKGPPAGLSCAKARAMRWFPALPICSIWARSSPPI